MTKKVSKGSETKWEEEQRDRAEACRHVAEMEHLLKAGGRLDWGKVATHARRLVNLAEKRS